MTLQDSVTTEPKRPRRERPTNLIQLLISLRDRYPNDGKDKLKDRFRDRVHEDEAFIDEAADKCFSLLYGQLTKPSQPAAPALTTEEKAALAAKAVAVVTERVVKLITLDTKINGIKLRDMTGAEVRSLGGIFATIAKEVRANQKVGEVLSNEQLAKLQA